MAFDLKFFDTHLRCSAGVVCDSARDFLAAVLRRTVAQVEPGESLRAAAERVLGEELGEFAAESGEAGESVEETLGKYLTLEIDECVSRQLRAVGEERGRPTVDALVVAWAILGDEALRKAVGKAVVASEDEVGSSYAARRWVGDDFERYSEEGRENGLLDPELEAMAMPLFDLGVSPAYDRDSGCFWRPLMQKVVVLELRDGRRVRVAMGARTWGWMVLDEKRLVFEEGKEVEGEASDEDKAMLKKLCPLVWDNEFYRNLLNKRQKVEEQR